MALLRALCARLRLLGRAVQPSTPELSNEALDRRISAQAGSAPTKEN